MTERATAASSTDLPPLPKPYRFDVTGSGQEDGWRVETTCAGCGVTVFLDSPDSMPAEKLWGELVEAEERGQTVGLLVPLRDALVIARSMVRCDHCVTELERERDQRAQAIVFRDRLQRSGLPKDLRALKWDDMERAGGRRDAIVAARAWTESTKGRLFLTGTVGVGKTRLAATALWDRLEHGDAIWMPVASLMQWAFFPSLSAERQRAQKALAAPVPLVLDDLGKEKPGDWARQIMFGAIDLRIQAGVPMVITSNLDADELTQRLGKGFGSRLRQFQQFELTGRDRRDNEDATE